MFWTKKTLFSISDVLGEVLGGVSLTLIFLTTNRNESSLLNLAELTASDQSNVRYVVARTTSI